MNVSIGERLEGLVTKLVADGRYGSNSEVVREGLRLVEEREAKLKALQDMLNASILEGGSHGPEDVAAYLDAEAAQLEREGY